MYALPFSENGEPSNEDHKAAWEKRRQQEERRKAEKNPEPRLTIVPG